jgi:predicted site-specific integrase-resolvase
MGHLYVIVANVSPNIVPTGVAAQALGIDRGTLHRWWKAGLVEPAFVTAGGHARWDVEDLKRQLREQRKTED